MSSCESKSEPPLRIALTPGEPAGIGPDLATILADDPILHQIVLVADRDLLMSRARLLGRQLTLAEYRSGESGAPTRGCQVLHVPLAVPSVPGHLNPANSAYVLATLERALSGCLQGEFAALVTGPVQKSVINDAGFRFTGHTEFLADHSGGATPVMLLEAGEFRVALVTTHLPLRLVPDEVTRARVEHTIRTVDRHLRERVRIERPKIAVCGLNPHAGEGGHLGFEEQQLIAPAIAACRDAGIAVEGPLPADTAFTPAMRQRFDCYISMFHDQGLPVLKALGFGHAVNITLGLPLVRTSVDHGTALELAGTGRIDAGSLRAAVWAAARLGGNDGSVAEA